MLLFTLGEMNGEVEVLEEGFKIPQCVSTEYHVTSITKCPTFETLDKIKIGSKTKHEKIFQGIGGFTKYFQDIGRVVFTK